MIFSLLQVEQEVVNYSLIKLAVKGGWLMLVLLALSLLALYIFGKKLWMIHKAGQIEDRFLDDIRQYVDAGNIKSAKTLCAHFDSPVSRMTAVGLGKVGRPSSEIQAAMESHANSEIARLENGLPYLATISGGAPMIGFLGTVIGMIQAFFNMANAGNNIDITLLSSGIYTAMITTVGGLIVGILAYFGYNFLNARIQALTYKMQETADGFVEMVSSHDKSTE